MYDTHFSNIEGGFLQSINANFKFEILYSQFFDNKHSVFNLSEDSKTILYFERLFYKRSYTKGRGGFIFNQNSQINLQITKGSQIFGNSCDSQGTVFYFHNLQLSNQFKQQIIIKDTIFNNNDSKFEGGVLYMNVAIFQQNQKEQNQNGLILIQNCEFNVNSAMSYGGVIFLNQVYAFDIIIKSSVFNNNRAGQKGGVIYGTNILKNKFQIGNYQEKYVENGINIYDGENLKNQNIFKNNYDVDYGGVLYLSNIQFLNIENNKFENNRANIQGGVIYFQQSVNQYITDSILEIFKNNIKFNVFYNNIVEQGMGGCIYYTTDPIQNTWDYILLNNEGSSIANNTFQKNFAGAGPTLKIDGEYQQQQLLQFIDYFDKNNNYENQGNDQLLLCKEEDGNLRYLNQGKEAGVIAGCQQGEFYSKIQKQCLPCKDNTYSLQVFDTQIQTQTVFSCKNYQHAQLLQNTYCTNCPDNAICDPYKGIKSKDTYYNFNLASNQILYCIENPKSCIQQEENKKQSFLSDVQIYDYNQCAQDYTGILCQECIGENYIRVNKICKKCQSDNLYIFPIFMKICFLIIYLIQGFYFRNMIESNAQKRVLQIVSASQKQQVKQILDPIFIPQKFTYLGNILKINLFICQIIVIFAQNSFYLPGSIDEFKEQIVYFFSYVGFPVGDDSSDLTCLLTNFFNKNQKQYSNLIWDYIFVFIYWISCLIIEFIIFIINEKKQKQQKKSEIKIKYANFNNEDYNSSILNQGNIDYDLKYSVFGKTLKKQKKELKKLNILQESINQNSEKQLNLDWDNNEILYDDYFLDQFDSNSSTQKNIRKKQFEKFQFFLKTRCLPYFLIIYFSNFPGILAKSFQLITCVQIDKGVSARLGDYSLNCQEYWDLPTILIYFTLFLHFSIQVGIYYVLFWKNSIQKGSKITQLNQINNLLVYGYLYYAETKEYLDYQYIKSMFILPCEKYSKYEQIKQVTNQKKQTFFQKFISFCLIKNRSYIKNQKRGEFFYWEPVKSLFLILFILVSNVFKSNVGYNKQETFNYLMVQGLNIIILVIFTYVFVQKMPYKNINLIRFQLLAQIFLLIGLACFFYMSVNSETLGENNYTYLISGYVSFIIFVVLLVYLIICSIDILLPEIINLYFTIKMQKQIQKIDNLPKQQDYYQQLQYLIDIQRRFQQSNCGKYYQKLQIGKYGWKKVQILYKKGDLIHLYYRTLYMKQKNSIYNNFNNKQQYNTYEDAFKYQIKKLREEKLQIKQIYDKNELNNQINNEEEQNLQENSEQNLFCQKQQKYNKIHFNLSKINFVEN